MHGWWERQNEGQEGGLSFGSTRDTWLSRPGVQGLECSSQELVSMAHLLFCHSQDPLPFAPDVASGYTLVRPPKANTRASSIRDA